MATLENTEENKVIDPTTNTREFDRKIRIGFFLLWAGLPCILCGIFLLLIRKKLVQFNESVDMVVNLIQAGEDNLDELQTHFPGNIDPLELGKEIVKFDLLPGYIVDFKSRRILSKGMHRVENKVRTITWECSACHAKNSVQTKGMETPVCEFCSTPKV